MFTGEPFFKKPCMPITAFLEISLFIKDEDYCISGKEVKKTASELSWVWKLWTSVLEHRHACGGGNPQEERRPPATAAPQTRTSWWGHAGCCPKFLPTELGKRAIRGWRLCLPIRASLGSGNVITLTRKKLRFNSVPALFSSANFPKIDTLNY